MANTWRVHRDHLPVTMVFGLLGTTGILLLMGLIGFGQACQKKMEMWTLERNLKSEG